MKRTTKPGAVLAAGLAVIALAASVPAGLFGRAVPAWSWVVWAAVLIASVAVLRRAEGGLVAAGRSLSWLVPPVLLFSLPAVFFAAAGQRSALIAALVARALATASAALATVAYLGPASLIAGLRTLRVPARLVDVIHSMVVGLAAIVRQASGMLRARTARRTGHAPWSALAASPLETARGFGRLTGALLLRSLERAEALERARSARGGGES